MELLGLAPTTLTRLENSSRLRAARLCKLRTAPPNEKSQMIRSGLPLNLFLLFAACLPLWGQANSVYPGSKLARPM